MVSCKLFTRLLTSLLAQRILTGILVSVVTLFCISVTTQTVSAACDSNATCKQRDNKKPYCDTKGQGSCVECLNDNQCGNGESCVKNECGTRSGGDLGGDTGTGVVQSVDNQGCYTSRADRSQPFNGAITEVGCIPKDPSGFAAEYYTIGLGMIGGLSVIFIIIGGYLMLTSQGNPIQLRNGKTYIFYALFGLLLAIFGYVFIEVIAIDILHVPGFSRGTS